MSKKVKTFVNEKAAVGKGGISRHAVAKEKSCMAMSMPKRIVIDGPSAACITVAVAVGVCYIAQCLTDAGYSFQNNSVKLAPNLSAPVLS